MRAVVQFSGGIGSYAATVRAIERFGRKHVGLLFADTLIEDRDLYRFIQDAIGHLGLPLIRLCDGRTPWDVFRDKRFLGNARIDPCSRVLKRDLLRHWIDQNCDPAETVVVLGIDWTEEHRFTRAIPRWKPYELWAPLCDRPYLDREQILGMLDQAGIAPPRLYGLGFPHNNCGGFCVKAGQAQFARLLEVMPERYAWHEAQEEALRRELGDVSIMVDRRGLRPGEARRPLSMREFREREQGVPEDEHDWGGCGCAID